MRAFWESVDRGWLMDKNASIHQHVQTVSSTQTATADSWQHVIREALEAIPRRNA